MRFWLWLLPSPTGAAGAAGATGPDDSSRFFLRPYHHALSKIPANNNGIRAIAPPTQNIVLDKSQLPVEKATQILEIVTKTQACDSKRNSEGQLVSIASPLIRHNSPSAKSETKNYRR